ncbi:MAG: hypothetical protein Q4A75_08435 [Peptostreptococcaceae bacterium]|nr:hypothetical protein [Peptostreptococcaceae bacterium]
MIKEIRNNMNVIESMIYFWTAVKDREKVGERYLVELSEYPEMKLLYDESFNAESVRRSLSAITNREMLNGGTQKERQFWNNNMWMLEDLSLMSNMVAPLKVLNLDALPERIGKVKDIDVPSIEVIFIPANKEEYFVVDNKLVINFFRVTPDLVLGGDPTIDGKPIMEYIEEKIIENF